MSHYDIYMKLNVVFTDVYNVTEDWAPIDKNSIRLSLISGEEMIFSYRGVNNWSLETVDSYFERIGNGNY